MKPLRRRDRKNLDLFCKDHAWGWRPPLGMRKINPTVKEVEGWYELRKIYIEAGRKRMVARGLTQYATPEELAQPSSS